LGICTNTHEGSENFVYDVNEEIRICVSPETEWIEAGDVLKMRLMQTGNQDQHFALAGNAERIIGSRFTFTNDGLYCVYSRGCSLHALSLQTGAVFTSVSGCNLIYFTRNRQVGYLFRSGTEERTILLTNLFTPFKFFSRTNASVVGKPIAAMFRSSNTVPFVSPDLKIITVWKTTAGDEGIPFIWESSLTASLPVKNCVLSSDGSLMAVHRETKVELYTVSYNTGTMKLFYSVYELKSEFAVECFAFSADSNLLLFCIHDSGPYSHFQVWDVWNKVMETSLKLSGLLTIECCLFSSDKRHVILCGDYEIEIWEYAKNVVDACRRLEVEIPYHSVKFAQCTVSLDNQLLACCIADRILIYNLLAPSVSSSKKVLRGHLGRIEFCRFLKANRYLISYGVDGMVFLWETSDLKPVAFARITQGNENIVTMALSPKEDIAFCFASSGRVYMIQLLGLGAMPSLKPLTPPSNAKLEATESIPRIPRQLASISEDDMAESSSSSDTEEDINDYYHEHDDDVYFM